jgi:hypothetical protein
VSPKSETSPDSTSSVTPLAYSIHEAAIALGGVSTRTVHNLMNAGQLVRRKIGARTVIPVSSVEAFLREDHATGQEGKRKR